MAMGDVIGRLAVVLGLDTAAFETGARRAAKTTNDAGSRMEALGNKVGTAAKALVGLGAAMAGSEIVRQVKDMAIAGLEHASALGEQAQQLGVTTSELQRYRYIATQVGIDSDVMDKGLAKLSITLGDLANGAKGPTEAMKRLGLSQQEIQQVSQMTAGQAIPFLADSFAKLKSPTEAAAIAADLFGAKMGGKFMTLLMSGKAGIEGLTAAYNKLGIEISDSQIKKADEAMDKMAELQLVVEATRAKIATDNSEGIVKGTKAWEELKTKAIVAVGQLGEASSELDKIVDQMDAAGDTVWKSLGNGMDQVDKAYDEFHANTNSKLGAAAAAVRDHVSEMAGNNWKVLKGKLDEARVWWADLSTSASNDMAALAGKVESHLIARLKPVWDALKERITAAKQQFFGLYDAVVGHSYIPDMVDEIGQHIGRLDDVMVKPIEKATNRSAMAFRKLQMEARKAFKAIPRSDRADVGANSAMLRLGLNGLMLSRPKANPFGAAPAGLDRQMLRLGFGGLLPKGANDNPFGAMSDEARAKVTEFATVFKLQMNGVGVTNVKVAKTFKDLADATLGAIDRMGQAFKGGSFLDKLGAIIGLGLQLGSLGVFGKGFQTRLNSTPGFANGTSFAPGGLALVGERGPELVNLPRGSQVVPNSKLGGMGATRVEIVPSPYFDVRVQNNIQQAAPAIASAGARAGEARVFSRQNRRVG